MTWFENYIVRPFNSTWDYLKYYWRPVAKQLNLLPELTSEQIVYLTEQENLVTEKINQLKSREIVLRQVYMLINEREAKQDETKRIIAQTYLLLKNTEQLRYVYGIEWPLIEELKALETRVDLLFQLLEKIQSLRSEIPSERNVIHDFSVQYQKFERNDENLFQIHQANRKFINSWKEEFVEWEKKLKSIRQQQVVLGLLPVQLDIQNMIERFEKFLAGCQKQITELYDQKSQELKRKAVSQFVHDLEKSEKNTGKYNFEDFRMSVKTRYWNLVKKKIECQICFSETKDFYELPCGHQYCYICLERTMTSEIDGGRPNEIHCPNPDCRQVHHVYRWLKGVKAITKTNENIDEENIDEENTEEKRSRLRGIQKKARLKLELAKGKRAIACPKAGCGGFQLRGKDQDLTTCYECLNCYCWLCQKLHLSKDDCDYKFESQADNKSEFKIDGILYKRCPDCDRPTQRMDGCNHMHCPCGYHWHWPSRTKWKGYGHGHNYTYGRWSS